MLWTFSHSDFYKQNEGQVDKMSMIRGNDQNDSWSSVFSNHNTENENI